MGASCMALVQYACKLGYGVQMNRLNALPYIRIVG